MFVLRTGYEQVKSRALFRIMYLLRPYFSLSSKSIPTLVIWWDLSIARSDWLASVFSRKVDSHTFVLACRRARPLQRHLTSARFVDSAISFAPSVKRRKVHRQYQELVNNCVRVGSGARGRFAKRTCSGRRQLRIPVEERHEYWCLHHAFNTFSVKKNTLYFFLSLAS